MARLVLAFLLCSIVSSVVSSGGPHEKMWAEEHQKYMEEYGNPERYFQGKFDLKNFGQTIQENAQKYMEKIKNENKNSMPNVNDADLRKNIGGIHERVRGKLEEPMSQLNMKDKIQDSVSDLSEKVSEKDENEKEEAAVEDNDEGKTKGKWSWGKILGVFGKGLKDVARSSMNGKEEGEGKENTKDDQWKRLENNFSDLGRYLEGAGGVPGKGDDVNPDQENLGQMIQKNGQKLLAMLTRNTKRVMNEKDVAKSLEELQGKFQENMKEPMTKFKKLQAEVENAITEDRKNETAGGKKNSKNQTAGEEKNWSWMKILGVAAKGAQDFLDEDQEIDPDDEEDLEGEEHLRKRRNTDEEEEQLPGMGPDMSQEGPTEEGDPWGIPEPTPMTTNEEGPDSNGGMETGEENEGADGGPSMGNNEEEKETEDEDNEMKGEKTRKERKEERKKKKEERKGRKEGRREKKEGRKEKKEGRKEKKEERKEKKEERKERKEGRKEKKEERKEKKEERKEKKEERKRKKEEKQKKKKGGQCLHKDTATKDDIGIFPCRKEMCADLPEQMLRLCKKTCLCRDDINLDSNCDVVKPVPKGDPRFNEFYKKHTIAHGLPILSSEKPDDKSLKRACRVVEFLLLDRQDIRLALYYSKAKAAVIGRTEKTRTIPEHSFLPADWDDTTRGVGGMLDNPISTAGEENLLCDNDLKYPDEDIFLHEFTHGIMLVGAAQVIPNFEDRVKETLKRDESQQRWDRTYARTNHMEYFAEGVQSYFNVNKQSDDGEPDGVHNHVNTRSELEKHDPALYALVEEVFPCGNVIWKRCDEKDNINKPTTPPRRDCSVKTGKPKKGKGRGRGRGKRPREN